MLEFFFGHAGPFSSRDMPGFVQEDPDIRNFNVKSLEFPIKYYIRGETSKPLPVDYDQK